MSLAALVGGVVGHGDDGPVRDVVQGVALAGVDAHGLIVDGAGVDQMGVALGVEVVHVGDVLEEVGVDFPFFHSGVGENVVVVGDDLQGDALLGQHVDHLLQDLLVGGGGSADLQGDRLAGGAGIFFGFGLAGGSAAAGSQTQAQDQGRSKGKKLFHGMGSSLKELGFISDACPFWWTAN